MIKGTDFIRKFEEFCPQWLAEESDPVGLQIGTLDKPVKKIMMTLDVRPEVVQEAIEQQVDLIIAKHPPIFRSLNNLVTDNFQTKMYADLLSHNIAVYAAHTNMDIIEGGLNDYFCQLLDITADDFLRQTHVVHYKKLAVMIPDESIEVLKDALFAIGVGEYSADYDHCSFSYEGSGTFRPKFKAQPTIGSLNVEERVLETKIEFIFPETIMNQVITTVKKVHPYEEPAYDIYTVDHLVKRYGLGRIGYLAQPIPLTSFVERVKEVFGLTGLRVVTDRETKMISRVAICGGSGEKFYHDALAKKADVYITGDVYYHTAHDMIEEKLTVIDPGHYIEEVCKEQFVTLFNQWKKTENWDVDFIVSQTNTNPFIFK
ncbi:Nif3-like dinuclear metal center hexameric protein [Vagococcus penaei]|uniref:GTP cyclohydrolase 1 type 2 homolog n=1 Tax=Vagococcus penaei TaxID=633807 RepID=A0A1Q2D3N4_9ENTE|nr:Nif3-like dinuclear metal center hexameric protein [Vagococcus penaei]AQP52952.1 Nif3-like dinuclear metal center hexameric protein [Vagococcus penaei]RSU02589.1 Nif3-like dinuclear metal center hexameric protein [Vagococcus penaei]